MKKFAMQNKSLHELVITDNYYEHNPPLIGCTAYLYYQC